MTDPNSSDAAFGERQCDSMTSELAALRQEVSRLNRQRFVNMHNSMPRLIGVQLVKGLALGFGTVVGATILVSLIALLLSKIDFLPIIGDWAAVIAAQMSAAK